MTFRGARSLAAAIVAIAPLAAAPSPALSLAWPAPYKSAETVASELLEVEAAHPEIVDVVEIGRSAEDRPIYAVKVSDNVAVDEGEPEVLVDALHHANEHVTVAQALDLLHLLADGTGRSPQIDAIVNERVTWIVPVVNPDGLDYDLSRVGGRDWRKNRQPTPGSRAIGTDLNRNYASFWRCCDRTGRDPASRRYAGPARFSAPETQAMRDFVVSRELDGVQRIRIYVSLHAAGRYVAWPIFPRSAGIPAITFDDRYTMDALVAGAAARNGYAAERYLPTGGTSTDWMYSTYKVPSLLVEIGAFTGLVSRFYPSATRMAAEVAGNRAALLWLIGEADCPSEAAGFGDRRCGPRFDDFEIEAGWIANPDGSDTATSGAFERARPAKVRAGTVTMQLQSVPSGYRALVTGAAAGRSAAANDLDGVSTVRSPAIALGAEPGDLAFELSFSYGSSATAADWFRVWVEAEDGTRTKIYERLAASRARGAAFATVRRALTDWANQTIRIVIGAGDEGSDSLVEVAVDDVRVERR